MSEENRISIDPEICEGKEILEEYSHITVDDING